MDRFIFSLFDEEYKEKRYIVTFIIYFLYVTCIHIYT